MKLLRRFTRRHFVQRPQKTVRMRQWTSVGSASTPSVINVVNYLELLPAVDKVANERLSNPLYRHPRIYF